MRKILTVLLLLLLPAAAWAQGGASGRELFQRGQYKAAYAALQPLARRGEPEALFLSIIIRRNDLDGRKAAGETAALWAALAAKSAAMQRAVQEDTLPEATLDAFRTALAHLEYFGPQPPAWPPGQPGPAQRERLERAEDILGSAAKRFAPAMNFAAFLALADDQPRQAFQHTRRAAELGDHLAMGNLAWMYREGVGTGKDDIRAAHWARRGCDSAPLMPRNANEVGYVYESGRGVSRDLAEARAWYEKASARGHPAGAANVQRLKSKKASAPVLDNLLYF
ncbi:MAG: sel1 repeat family protein [Candidatus Adiutrix sp.]|jgi:TPR repeat protein|nr:sel1 repeat family protein [Candidatus Adiutrix sp.]